MRVAFLSLLMLLSTFLSSQIDQKVGSWQSHLPYNTSIDVAQSDEEIIYATPFALMMISKADYSVRFLSKVEGLSDAGITLIEYDQFNNQLVVIYNNSNIDIIRGNEVINIPTIKLSTSITGSKEINDLHIFDQHTAFLATSFGIVELRLDRLEFGSTIFTNEPIKRIGNEEQLILATSETGLYYIEKTPQKNIADFSKWIKAGENLGLPATFNATDVIGYDGEVFLSTENNLWRGTIASGFESIYDMVPEPYHVSFMSTGQDGLILGLIQDDPYSKLMTIHQNNFTIGAVDCSNRLEYAIQDTEGKYWYADEWRGFRFSNDLNSGCQILDYGGPLTANVSDIDFKDEAVYVATGGVKDNFEVLSNRSGFFIYKDKQWQNYYDINVPLIRDEEFLNIFQVATSPRTEEVYFASYYNGLMSFHPDTEETEYFDAANSGLQHAQGETEGERLSGLSFDEAGNLWINNIYAPRPLVVYTEDGNWFNYSTGVNRALALVEVDYEGLLWNVVVGSSGGVLVYDHNNTLNDPTDDDYILLNANNSAMTSSKVNCLAVDLDGDIWAGTDEGPVIFNGGRSIFTVENPGNRLKVELDNNIAYLLSNENITSIAVDGGDRKWIGTNNGVFVLSAGGDEEIMHFTEDNSPLFSNDILELSFDKKNGLMYIGSNLGIQSYRTATTDARRVHSSDVYAFPNPVRPEHTGNIYISGLAKDADVKITDLNGKLIYETTALGGTATWDGKDYNGRRAATGVYLVFSTGQVDFETPDALVTKIMIVH